MIEREVVVKELIPSGMHDYMTTEEKEELEKADVKYRFMIGRVDDEVDNMVGITQIKILETPEDEQEEYQEMASFHMTGDAFKVFLEALADFTKEEN